ncbi:MAG: VanZ family protein [Bacteroidales bacterium]|nr:VanZ family protein [Bacteroidales bacterium]
MFDKLPFGLEQYIFTLIPDEVFIYLPLLTLVLVVLFWRFKCHVLLAAYTVLLLCHTVIFRHVNETIEYSFIPFAKLFSGSGISADAWWEISLNVVLFIPIGVLLTCVLGKAKWKLVMGIGALLSLTIELLQLVLKRGMCETDDLLANTLGCAIGVVLVMALSKCKQKFFKA